MATIRCPVLIKPHIHTLLDLASLHFHYFVLPHLLDSLLVIPALAISIASTITIRPRAVKKTELPHISPKFSNTL